MNKKSNKGKAKPFQPFSVDDNVSVRKVRGPNKDGHNYLSVIRYDGKEHRLFSMWGTPGSVAAEYQRRKDTGTLDTPKPKKEIADPITVGQLVDRWFDACKADPKVSAKKATLRRIKSTTELITEKIGDVLLTQFGLDRQVEFKNTLLSEYADTTYNITIQGFRQAWKFASDRGWVSVDLFLKKLTKPEYELEKYTPSNEELDLLFANLVGEDWCICALKVCRETGIRVGELSSIRWSSINYANKRLSVSGKTGQRYIPMSKKLIDIFKSWQAEQVPVGKWNNIFGVSIATANRYPNMVLEKSCEKAGIAHRVVVHSIRRNFVSRLRKANVSVKVGAAICGHSIETHLKLYSEIEDSEKDDAMSAVEKMFDKPSSDTEE